MRTNELTRLRLCSFFAGHGLDHFSVSTLSLARIYCTSSIPFSPPSILLADSSRPRLLQIGVSIGGTVLFSHLRAKLPTDLPPSIISTILRGDFAGIVQMEDESMRREVRRVLADALRKVWVVVCASVGAAFVVSSFHSSLFPCETLLMIIFSLASFRCRFSYDTTR